MASGFARHVIMLNEQSIPMNGKEVEVEVLQVFFRRGSTIGSLTWAEKAGPHQVKLGHSPVGLKDFSKGDIVRVSESKEGLIVEELVLPGGSSTFWFENPFAGTNMDETTRKKMFQEFRALDCDVRGLGNPKLSLSFENSRWQDVQAILEEASVDWEIAADRR